MTKSTKPSAGAKARAVKRTTKKDQLIKLLGSKAGADIRTLSDKLEWQHHTTRAAVSGLRKAGYEVSNERSVKDGVSKYRIISAPAATGSSAKAAVSNGA